MGTVIDRPERITLSAIAAERDVAIRRVLLERYGFERYIRGDPSAVAVHTDDWGTLWRATVPGDEPLTMVEVLNSSPEPDGTFKDHFLRVPPDVRSAHQAVAWTFGVAARGYEPEVQT